MNNFYIEGSKSTPEVSLDAERHVLMIKGQSYPENAFRFYEPILEWVKQYFEQKREQVQIEIKLPYVNTSSSKCIMMLLDQVEQAYTNGNEVCLHWYIDEDNESELECAEEFKEDFDFPFHIIPLSPGSPS
ncbi:DUF1987 domain-containing protein [Ammoniphilus sp. YIM 78166]|uniref:DUF1987 domain-containing protein n=1 Tax=Ammoniphilus sp. YIM 78166 TaxID=1644106 RepID=UPI0010703A84|nr:DUF1987 domain-containing protein [Ammoniphilus sp. YIM 78166]